MTEFIGRYQLEGELTNSDAGNCRWGFGRRDGKDYFIKEFLSPVYPMDTDNIDADTVARKRKRCDAFVLERTQAFKQLNYCSDGNLCRIEEFFRYGSKYYIAMEKIERADEDMLCRADAQQKLTMCRALARLHASGLVHGDIKMANIVPYVTRNGMLSAKIIDVDGCYWKIPADESRRRHD